MCAGMGMHAPVSVEVREQLSGVASLLLWIWGLQLSSQLVGQGPFTS